MFSPGIRLSIWSFAGGGTGSAIILSSYSMPETITNGTSIGTLSVAGGTGTYTFTITDDPDDVFSVDATSLDKLGTVDFETKTFHQVTISADNGVDPPIVQTLTVQVLDVGPTITSAATASVDEGDTLAHSLTADESVTWSIVGGVDELQFDLSGSTLTWVANGTQDYGAPADANLDNNYVVEVQATSVATAEAVTQIIVITVSEVVDVTAPAVSTYSPADNATGVAIGATLTATFDETVTLGASGTITLKKTSDDSTIDSWDVATDGGSSAGQVEVLTNTALTMHLTTDLAVSTEFYVIWDAGVVKDGSNNNVAALSSTTTWSFTTTSGAGLEPDDVSGIWAWWKADSGTYQNTLMTTPATSNADPVLGWQDQSINNRNLTSVSGTGMTLRTNVVNTLPVIRIDGLSNYFDVTPSPAALTAVEVFVVVKVTVASATNNALWHYCAEAGGGGNEWFPYGDENIYDGFGSTVRKSLGTPIVALRTNFRLFNVISVSGEWTANIDGAQQYTTATNTVGWFATPYIGYGGAGQFTGDIAEIFIFDNKISTGNRTAMEDYVQTKYGLTF